MGSAVAPIVLRFRVARRRAGGLTVLLAAWCLLAAGVGAQDVWTQDALQAERADAEADPALSDEQRSEVLALWDEALALRASAEDWAATRERFVVERESAPVRTAALRSALAQRRARQPPELPADDDVARLEQGLAAAESELGSLRSQMEELGEERSQRTTRRLAIPDLMAAARKALETLDDAEPAAEGDPAARARQARDSLARLDLERSLEALTAELSSYDARSELIGLRQDELAADLKDAQADVDEWTAALTVARRAAAEQTSERALQSVEGVTDLRRVTRLAEEVAGLSERSVEIQALRVAAQAQLLEVGESLELVTQLRDTAELKVDAAGLNDTMAVLLRDQRTRIATLRTPSFSLGDPEALGSELNLDTIDWSADRIQLSRLDREVERLLAEEDAVRERAGGEGLNGAQREQAATVVRNLLEEKRQIIDELTPAALSTLAVLDELQADSQALDESIEGFERFIDQHILWVRSLPAVDLAALTATLESLLELIDPRGWASVTAGVTSRLDRKLPGLLAGVLLVLTLLALRPIARRHIRTVGEGLAGRRLAPIGPTLTVLAMTLAGAALWPALTALIGWRLSLVPDVPLASALGSGLLRLSLLLIPVELLIHLTRPAGLAEVHLGWGSLAQRGLRSGARLLQLFVVPGLGVALVCDAPEVAYELEPAGRVGLVVALVGLLVTAQQQFRADGPVVRASRGQGAPGWIMRLRWAWYPLAMLTPLGLLVSALLGYQYGTVQVVVALLHSGALLLSVLVARGVARRWLLLARVRLAFQQRQRRREQRAESEQANPEVSGEIQAVVEEALEKDVTEIDEQAQRLLDVTAGLLLMVGMLLIWADLLPALERLRQFELWNRGEVLDALGETVMERVNLADALLAMVAVGFTVLATRNIPGLLEMTVLRRMTLEPGGGYAITTLCRYCLTLIGLVTAAQLLGITWDSVQWMAAAITVGLGFGLQEIFANFVAGLIILFERPIRVGDIITVGGIEGVVTKIRTRATTIRDRDRRELLVPNKEFITSQLVNWTLSDPISRLIMEVGVAYGSDGELVERTLVEVAGSCSMVLENPSPQAVFRSFGDSTLNYELRVFIADRDYWPQVTHELNSAIHDVFGERGIEIAFPQQDVHLRDGLGDELKVWLGRDGPRSERGD